LTRPDAGGWIHWLLQLFNRMPQTTDFADDADFLNGAKSISFPTLSVKSVVLSF
jgi:hypothetical protein